MELIEVLPKVGDVKLWQVEAFLANTVMDFASRDSQFLWSRYFDDVWIICTMVF